MLITARLKLAKKKGRDLRLRIVKIMKKTKKTLPQNKLFIQCRKCEFEDVYGQPFLHSDSIILIWRELKKTDKRDKYHNLYFTGICGKHFE